MAKENDTIKVNITRIEIKMKEKTDILEQNTNELNILKEREKLILQRRKITEDLFTAQKTELEVERAKLMDNE